MKIEDLGKTVISFLEKGVCDKASILSWLCLFEVMWNKGNEVRNQLNVFVRNKLPPFLSNLFSNYSCSLSTIPTWNNLSFFSKFVLFSCFVCYLFDPLFVFVLILLELVEMNADEEMMKGYVYYLSLKCVPAIVRLWFVHDLDRKIFSSVEKFTMKFMTPSLLTNEMENVETEMAKQSFDNFVVKTAKALSEVTASYEKDDFKLTSNFLF